MYNKLKWLCITFKVIHIISNSNSNLISDISKSISAELAKFKSESDSDVTKNNMKLLVYLNQWVKWMPPQRNLSHGPRWSMILIPTKMLA